MSLRNEALSMAFLAAITATCGIVTGSQIRSDGINMVKTIEAIPSEKRSNEANKLLYKNNTKATIGSFIFGGGILAGALSLITLCAAGENNNKSTPKENKRRDAIIKAIKRNNNAP